MQEHRLQHSAEAARLARKLAYEAAASRIPEERVDEFVLMVSEAVANAILHARPEDDGRFRLRFESDGRVLRCVVIDRGPGFAPDRATAGHLGRSEHFGLKIIGALSDRWGVSRDGATAVWFEVELPTSQRRTA